jgi:dipeptide/tripeptide permease
MDKIHDHESGNSMHPKSNKMPAAIPYIVGNEAAERFNFYGLKAILATFMIQAFLKNNPEKESIANGIAHDFTALAYLTPLFGAMLSDWFLGKYKTILYLSMVYLVGNLVLSYSVFEGVNNFGMFQVGLLLIAIGTGGIKPCVSSNVGDQFNKSNEHLIPKAFDAFYFSINFGSLLSILLIPYLKAHYPPAVAFGVPAVTMGLAAFIFWMGRHKYVKIPPKGDKNKVVIFFSSLLSFLACFLYFHKDGMGPVILSWFACIIVLAFVLQQWWFAAPGNFIGINLYALINGGFAGAAKKYGAETIEGIGCFCVYSDFLGFVGSE